ncbi:elongator complex protein 3 [Terrisporobacter sp.]
MKKRIIPIFVPHRGCPHDCIFCNQKKITGVSTDVTSEQARNIIEEYLPTIPQDASVEIAFFGGSFTAIDEQTQNELLSVAKEYVDRGLVSDIRMSTRPDCISVDILNRLKKYSVSIIELGVQSMDEKVLHDSARGHDIESVINSAKLIKESGINLGLQMMVGLPSDTEEKCIETARKFIELNPFCVRIYPTLVVKDTGLETLLNKDEYKPFTLEQSIQIVKKLLVLFYVNNINVIRVGLQATEDIQLGRGIVDGPYHPAFRELVEGEMIKDYLHYLVIQNKTVSQIEVKTNNKNISKIVGNKKSNKLFFKNQFNINMKTTPSNISEDEFIIILDNDKEINVTSREIYKKLLNIYNL